MTMGLNVGELSANPAKLPQQVEPVAITRDQRFNSAIEQVRIVPTGSDDAIRNPGRPRIQRPP
jgi:hypothetical protein